MMKMKLDNKYNNKFSAQVKLVIKCLQTLRDQQVFALKGGTAINLFHRNLPRLSIDIDLTYMPCSDRQSSIGGIQNGLRMISRKVESFFPDFQIREQRSLNENILMKLYVYDKEIFIKIEPNFIMRGSLYDVEYRALCDAAKLQFGLFIDQIPVLNSIELYAGKICAALNRQHPRDLFDIKLLLEAEGIPDQIRHAFVVYLSCDKRPIHELLAPHKLDVSTAFKNEYLGMTDYGISLDELINTRELLIAYLNKSLTDAERQFLLSVKQGVPDYSLMSFKNLEKLPSLQWKLLNIKKMEKAKHNDMLAKLSKVLQG